MSGREMELSVPSRGSSRVGEFHAVFPRHSRNSPIDPATKVLVMKTLLWTCLFLLALNCALADAIPSKGVASWYGEEHRGRLMANGKKFNPDKLTAASWFYPLGTKVRVTLKSEKGTRTVLVTITDRGPAKELVRDG